MCLHHTQYIRDFVDPYGRANSDGENTAVGGAATSDPYWSNMEDPTMREPKGLLHLHTVIVDVTLPACRLQVYRHICPVLPPLHTVTILKLYLAYACAYRSVQESLCSLNN